MSFFLNHGIIFFRLRQTGYQLIASQKAHVWHENSMEKAKMHLKRFYVKSLSFTTTRNYIP